MAAAPATSSRSAARSRPRPARTTSASSASSSRSCSRRPPSRRASATATSRPRCEETYRGYRFRTTTRRADRRRGLARAGYEPSYGLTRRRRGRERVQRARAPVRQPRERDGRDPHARRAHRRRRPRADGRGDARPRRGRRAVPLSLRRARSRGSPSGTRACPLEVDGDPVHRVSRLTGPGRARRRRDRQRAGTCARARLRRVRRPLREPDAGARPRPEDGAHVITLPYTPGQSRSATPRRTRRLPSGSTACRSSAAPCTARSRPVCAGARWRAGRVRPARAAARCRSSLSDTVRALQAAGCSRRRVAVAPCLDGDVQCVPAASALAWARAGLRRGRVRIGPGIVGTGSRLGHGGLAAAEAANAATALGGIRCSWPASRTATRASATTASRTTRAPCSSSASARSRSRGPPALTIRLARRARGRRRRAGGGLCRPAARAHGPWPGRRPVVFRLRLRRRPARRSRR